MMVDFHTMHHHQSKDVGIFSNPHTIMASLHIKEFNLGLGRGTECI